MKIFHYLSDILRIPFTSKKSLYVFLILFWLLILSYYHTHKDLPLDLNYKSIEYAINDSNLEFLYDLSYLNEEGDLVHEQQIFDKIFEQIEKAEKYILIDMFLFNSYTANYDAAYKKLAGELTTKLIEKKKNNPDIKIDFITDPINSAYAGGTSYESEKLKEAGINLIVSNLLPLKDSNFLYSPIWRTFIQWFGNKKDGGIIKHPFSQIEPKVSIRTYLNLINFKANHRKIFVADDNGQLVSVITSANPHNGSSAHSNVAMLVRGNLGKDIIRAEKAVAKMSEKELSEVSVSALSEKDKNARVSILSESRIKKAILKEINNSKDNEEINLAQFYFADRDIIKSLLDATDRGVVIKIILDPNKDAFGYEKNGIPNRQVAHELLKESEDKIQFRWYDTHGEQFHTKLFIKKNQDKLTAIMGSANLTRRNLDNYNLELDVKVDLDIESKVATDIDDFFNRIWNNTEGNYTVAYTNYKDESFFKKLIYRIQEKTGLSSF